MAIRRRPVRQLAVDSRTLTIDVSAAATWAPIQWIGGTTGWYHAGRLWKLRSFLYLMFGGVGLRRGRSHEDNTAVGDAIDCWRVEQFESGRLL